MSIKQNTTSLQNLLEKVNALPDANSVGEDVADETAAYTEKLAELGTAITALETELEGKAAGSGSSGGVCPSVTITAKASGFAIGVESIHISQIIYFSNGNWQYTDFMDIPIEESITLQDIDINEPIIFESGTNPFALRYLPVSDNALKCFPSDTYEATIGESKVYVIKITDTNPAEINVKVS